MLGLLLVAGCTGGASGAAGPDSPQSDPPAEHVAAPDPAILAVGALFDDEGALPLDAAQRLFATVVEPLPGVEPLADAGLTSGTTADEHAHHGLAGMAVRRMDAARDQLPPDVVAVLDAVVEPAEGETEVVIAPARARTGADAAAGTADVPPPDELAEMIARVVGELEALSGHDLRVPIEARTVPGLSSHGLTTGRYTPAGGASACRVALKAEIFAGSSESAWSTIAHEVWHCFQLDADPVAFGNGPQWVVEGQAEWAGEEHIGGSPSSRPEWDTWLLTPESSLTRRSYDAIGLYGTADASGADVWRTMLPMLGLSTEPAVATLFGNPVDIAAAQQAMAHVRIPALGAEWESHGPGITDARTEFPVVAEIGAPGEIRMSLARFGTLPVRLHIGSGDVLLLRADGGAAASASLPGTGTIELAPGVVTPFCLADGGCACPDGSVPGGTEILTASAGDGAVAVGAVTAGEAAVSAEILTVDEACARAPSLVGTWETSVAAVMGSLSSAYGEQFASCTGPWLVTFGADATWHAGFSAECYRDGITMTSTASMNGSWTSNATSFTVTDLVGEGSLTVAGVTMPLPVVDGFRDSFGGSVAHTIVGDVLTYTVDTPEGKQVLITLTRVG